MDSVTFNYKHVIAVPPEYMPALKRGFDVNGFQSQESSDEETMDGLARMNVHIALNIPTEFYSMGQTISGTINTLTRQLERLTGVEFDTMEADVFDQMLVGTVRSNMHDMAVRLVEAIVRTALPDGVAYKMTEAEV